MFEGLFHFVVVNRKMAGPITNRLGARLMLSGEERVIERFDVFWANVP
jgi:hypothetical protein